MAQTLAPQILSGPKQRDMPSSDFWNIHLPRLSSVSDDSRTLWRPRSGPSSPSLWSPGSHQRFEFRLNSSSMTPLPLDEPERTVQGADSTAKSDSPGSATAIRSPSLIKAPLQLKFVDREEFTESKPYACEQCTGTKKPRSFKRASNLRAHLQTHTKGKEYFCDVCFEGFTRKNDLQRHELLHGEDKPRFVCGGVNADGTRWGCGREFNQHGNLLRHVRSRCHKDIVQHKPPTSSTSRDAVGADSSSTPAAYPLQNILSHHEQQASHSGQVSDKSATAVNHMQEVTTDVATPSSDGISKHVLTDSHGAVDSIRNCAPRSATPPPSQISGIRPVVRRAPKTPKHPATFSCQLCSKQFCRAYNLRSHLRTHIDDRPFVCTICGKAFAREYERKWHEGLHSRERKFACRGDLSDDNGLKHGTWGCGRRFALADALGRHFKSEAGRACLRPLLDEEARQMARISPKNLSANAAMISTLELSLEATSVHGEDIQELMAADKEAGIQRRPIDMMKERDAPQHICPRCHCLAYGAESRSKFDQSHLDALICCGHLITVECANAPYRSMNTLREAFADHWREYPDCFNALSDWYEDMPGSFLQKLLDCARLTQSQRRVSEILSDISKARAKDGVLVVMSAAQSFKQTQKYMLENHLGSQTSP